MILTFILFVIPCKIISIGDGNCPLFFMLGYNFGIGGFFLIHIVGFGITVFIAYANQSIGGVFVEIFNPIIVVIVNVLDVSHNYFIFSIAIGIRLHNIIFPRKAIERDFTKSSVCILKQINNSFGVCHQPIAHIWKIYLHIV